MINFFFFHEDFHLGRRRCFLRPVRSSLASRSAYMLGCCHLFHTFLANVYFYMSCRSSYSRPLGNNKPSLPSSLAPLSCSENIVSASAS
jgi:hypothetical protein